jgi:DnaK suppressor protein
MARKATTSPPAKVQPKIAPKAVSKTAVKQSPKPAKKAVPQAKAPAAKVSVAKTPGTKATKAPVTKAPAKHAAKPAAKTHEAKPAAPNRAKAAPPPVKKKAPAPAAAVKTKSRAERNAFFTAQRQLLMDERQTYISSAEALKAQADSLALEHEPGDVQFDEEGGEGGTANVDREIDLHLSAQARATVVEIDRALAKIADGTYGICEQCGNPIPDARLQALPYAALCVSCKSGGLSSRR